MSILQISTVVDNNQPQLVFKLRTLCHDHDIDHVARSSADNALREDATLVSEVGVMKRGGVVHLDGMPVGLDAENGARFFQSVAVSDSLLRPHQSVLKELHLLGQRRQ